MPSEEPQELLTINEAAARLKLSPATIRKRIDANKIAGAFKDGDDDNSPWLIPAKSLGLEPELDPVTFALLEAKADSQAAQLETNKRKIDQLTNDLEHTQAELSKADTERSKAIADGRVADAKATQLEERLTDAKALAAKAEAEVIDLRDERRRLEQAAHELELDLTEARANGSWFYRRKLRKAQESQ